VFQATAATVEHPNISPKIIEKVEAKSEEGLLSSITLKPEISKMHSEIMSL
jgi:peptidoglycan hydrolase CwlO-like protein